MSDEELQLKILKFLYQKWVEDPFRPIRLNNMLIERNIEIDEKFLEANADFLVDKGLIESPKTIAYNTRITIYGIEIIEDKKSSKDIVTRRRILELMKNKHNKDPHSRVNNQVLVDELKLSNNEMLRNMWYLGKMGYADVDWYLGGVFSAKINAYGVEALKEPDLLEQEHRVMSSAYSKLYLLENKLRIFITQIMLNEYGENWWIEGISIDIKRRAEQKQEQEYLSQHGSIFYTDFGDLRKIIINNWIIFEPMFKTQGGTLGRLEELEMIRNKIAHTRFLTEDEIRKLELFYKDIITIISN